jgi:hypothetical protein
MEAACNAYAIGKDMLNTERCLIQKFVNILHLQTRMVLLMEFNQPLDAPTIIVRRSLGMRMSHQYH